MQENSNKRITEEQLLKRMKDDIKKNEQRSLDMAYIGIGKIIKDNPNLQKEIEKMTNGEKYEQ